MGILVHYFRKGAIPQKYVGREDLLAVGACKNGVKGRERGCPVVYCFWLSLLGIEWMAFFPFTTPLPEPINNQLMVVFCFYYTSTRPHTLSPTLTLGDHGITVTWQLLVL